MAPPAESATREKPTDLSLWRRRRVYPDRLPYESVVRIAKFRKHVNVHIVVIRDLWGADGAEDLTMKFVDGVDHL